jgi:proteasome activator subunit 4
VLKSIKNMMDVVCLHLSRPLFDLALKVVFEYAATNARANSVRAFGGLVACLARAYPRETLDKFLPHCAARIEEELNHGASSTRTTSSHQAVPSDTALHWSMYNKYYQGQCPYVFNRSCNSPWCCRLWWPSR